MVQIQEDHEEEPETNGPNQPSSSTEPPPNHNAESPSSASSISSDHTFHGFSPPKSHPSPAAAPPSTAIVSTSRLIWDQPEMFTKTKSDAETGFAADGSYDGGSKAAAERKPRRIVGSGLSQTRRVKAVKRVGFVLRFCEFVVCLVSFSIMAADKRRGWALDSFDRYIEFRYSMTINVISFSYAGLQGLDLLLQLITGKNLLPSQLRSYFDFAVDQVLAYLLLSSSSSAFTRVDDWISNWGKDKFPAMASASVGVSFMAYIAFAFSALISGYTLCTHSHT